MSCGHNCLLASLLLVATVAVEAEVFRWVDEQGMVHYGSRPPADADAQTLTLPSGSAGEPVIDDAAAARRERQQRLLEAYDRERSLERAASAREEARQNRVAAYCDDLLLAWRRLNHGGPVFEDTPAGRVYLSEAQRIQRRASLRQVHQRHCDGELP
jgi:hypothetical protein